jgi:hypothetical protein
LLRSIIRTSIASKTVASGFRSELEKFNLMYSASTKHSNGASLLLQNSCSCDQDLK